MATVARSAGCLAGYLLFAGQVSGHEVIIAVVLSFAVTLWTHTVRDRSSIQLDAAGQSRRWLSALAHSGIVSDSWRGWLSAWPCFRR